MKNVSCPVPKFDFDTITSGHGSGGLLTHNLLKNGVFSLLGNEFLNQQHDGAILNLTGPLAFSTDSYVISPIRFPGGSIGDLAVNGTVNDLAMCGANAKYLSLGFILEEGLSMEEFGLILNDIREAANRCNVMIVTGDTKVVEKGKGDKIFINTSGIGSLHPKAHIHHNRILPGDVILINSKIAAHGMAIMSKRNGLEFETDIISDTKCLKEPVFTLLDNLGNDVKFLRDATRGGIASVLNEIAELTRLDYEINQSDIPLDDQVEGACEMLGLDPLYVANEGVFIVIVSPESAEKALELLKNTVDNEAAAIIGQVTSGHGGKVLMRSRIGGKRVVAYLAGEQLPRIC